MLRPSVLLWVWFLPDACRWRAPDVPVSDGGPRVEQRRGPGHRARLQEPTGVTAAHRRGGVPPGSMACTFMRSGVATRRSSRARAPHWNPTTSKHGHRNPDGFHMGDLGNLGVGADGKLVAGLLVPEQATMSTGRVAMRTARRWSSTQRRTTRRPTRAETAATASPARCYSTPMAKNGKLPKRIAGVKIPKKLRKRGGRDLRAARQSDGRRRR